MIPNFHGCCEYNPPSDPLKGLSKEDKDQFAFQYMEMWVRTEGFDDYAIMFEAGDADLLAHALVSSGAIDSKNCYPSCKAIEHRIEGWAKAFRKLSQKTRRKRYDSAFKDCMIVSCSTCNHTQFPAKGNYEMYRDTLDKECWECRGDKVNVEKWNPFSEVNF